MRIAVLAGLLGIAACGGGGASPASPTPPPPPPKPADWTLSGSLVDTVTGGPVAGATIAFANYPSVTTGSDGTWTLRSNATGVLSRIAATIDAPGYVTRETGVTWNSSGRGDIHLDLIPDRAPFSLAFFREFVRNGFEAPGALEPVRRWTKAPSFYINTTNPHNGSPLPPSEIEMLQQVIRDTVPQLTGGQFGVAAIELGSTPRDRRQDFINVNFVEQPDENICGRAFVGSNPGEITINYARCRDACGNFSPDTVAHEVGHAMGFWHTKAESIMNPYGSGRCANFHFSPDELLHARVAYARSPGNRDTDQDPTSFSAIEIEGSPRVVVCRR